jgi:hypothetical protein
VSPHSASLPPIHATSGVQHARHSPGFARQAVALQMSIQTRLAGIIAPDGLHASEGRTNKPQVGWFFARQHRAGKRFLWQPVVALQRDLARMRRLADRARLQAMALKGLPLRRSISRLRHHYNVVLTFKLRPTHAIKMKNIQEHFAMGPKGDEL